MAEAVHGGRLTRIYTAYGPLEAEVMKSHLDAEGIPVLLKYESVSLVFGIAVDGLSKVELWVPEGMAEEAKEIVKVGAQ